jgi:hypothetical protein
LSFSQWLLQWSVVLSLTRSQFIITWNPGKQLR